MKMELEKIGSRHRDSTNHFAAESEALDQIAKEVSEFCSEYYSSNDYYFVYFINIQPKHSSLVSIRANMIWK